MFCGKCGKELKNNEAFCPYCGTRSLLGNQEASESVKKEAPTATVNASSGSPNTGYTLPAIQFNISDVARKFFALGNLKIWFCANIGCLLFSMIFALTKNFQLNADSIIGYSRNEKYTMFGEADAGSLIALSVILNLFALGCVIFPLLIKADWIPLVFLPSKIATFIHLIWFLFFFIVGTIESSSQAQAYEGLATTSFGLTFTGWLYLILMIGALVTSFKISYDLKRKNAINRNKM